MARVGKLPVRFGLGLQWMAVQPDRFRPRVERAATVAPVLPKLVKGNLADLSSFEFGLGR